jgi:hypothetical protein
MVSFLYVFDKYSIWPSDCPLARDMPINFNFLDLIALQYQVTSTNYGVTRDVMFFSCWLSLFCCIPVLVFSNSVNFLLPERETGTKPERTAVNPLC